MRAKITKIANKSGISQGFFSNILAGRRRPHYKKSKEIAAVTGTDPVLWLEGSPEEMREAINNLEAV